MTAIDYAEMYGEDGEPVPYSDDELEDAKQALALAKWTAMDADACEFLLDNASSYIVDLVRGGLSAEGARQEARRDCIGHLAYWATDADARAWLDKGN